MDSINPKLSLHMQSCFETIFSLN